MRYCGISSGSALFVNDNYFGSRHKWINIFFYHILSNAGVNLEDGITQRDLDIAIAVSVVVTAVVIVALVGIIYCLRRKCNCKYRNRFRCDSLN